MFQSPLNLAISISYHKSINPLINPMKLYNTQFTFTYYITMFIINITVQNKNIMDRQKEFECCHKYVHYTILIVLILVRDEYDNRLHLYKNIKTHYLSLIYILIQDFPIPIPIEYTTI